MKLEERMTRLEVIVEKHMEESGNIRTDLAWLKKAMFALIGGGLTFNITLAVAFIMYLIKR